jgi:hypothetical protein
VLHRGSIDHSHSNVYAIFVRPSFVFIKKKRKQFFDRQFLVLYIAHSFHCDLFAIIIIFIIYVLIYYALPTFLPILCFTHCLFIFVLFTVITYGYLFIFISLVLNL